MLHRTWFAIEALHQEPLYIGIPARLGRARTIRIVLVRDATWFA